jgi:RsiW-degrading membrane proteinase PrsW (M82 family)
MRLTLVVLLLALVASLTGCGQHLAGTNDDEIEYVAKSALPPSKTAPADSLKARITRRLGAIHVSATVDAVPPNRARITVAHESAEDVDEALLWRGGLAGYEDAKVLAQCAQPEGGRAERSCLGLRVTGTPAFDWAEDVVATKITDGGRAVAVTIKPEAAKAARRATEGRPVILARAHNTLTALEIPEDGKLTLRFGTDIYSYSRAARIDTLLSSGTLPALERVAIARKPPSWPLAILGLVLPMLLSLSWLFFVRRFDRAHPEPLWLVLATFALGGASVVLAALAEYACMHSTPYLNPSVMSLGGQLIAFPIELLVFTLVVGFAEEGAKFLAAWSLATHTKHFDEPVDGIVYGAASALGFAAVENIKYFAVGRLTATIIVMRSLTSVPAHMFFGAIWGYALGKKLISKKTSIFLFLGWAALMHGAFDTFLTIHGMQLFAFALNLALASLFVFLLRKSLRHGVVVPGFEAIADEHRKLFTMGSRSTFALWAIALHILAVGVVVIGGYYEMTNRQVSYAFLSLATGVLVLLGFAAHGVATSLPLDAVVDVHGVTFAGTRREWATITGFETKTSAFTVLGQAIDVFVRSTDGDLHVGPGRGTEMILLLRELENRTAPKP